MKNNVQKKFKINWQKLLVPEFRIYGVSLNDYEIKIFCFDKSLNKISTVNKFVLPAGIIKEGILQNPEAFKSFFSSLKEKLWRKEKNVWIILSLPSANFYINYFSLPELSETQLKDAVIFNAQMAAPLPLEESYFDWEDWGLSQKEFEKEIFIALGIKKQIDPYWEIFKDLGLKIVAIEPYALSLTRFVYNFLEQEEPVLIIDVRNDGMEFVISEGKKLIYFDYDSWHEIFGQNIPQKILPSHLEKHLLNEIPMILNFYSLKRQKSLKRFLLLSENDQLLVYFYDWLNKNYGLNPLEFNVPPFLKNLKRDWAGVVGCALRGLISRGKDTIVSLAPIQTEEDYYQSHLISTVSLWLKIIVTVLGCFTLVYGLVDYALFIRTEKRFAADAIAALNPTILQKQEQLQRSADEFNTLVRKAEAINTFKKDFAAILNEISNQTKDSITLKRIFITDSGTFNITITGEAKSKEAIVNFKQTLEEKRILQDSSLPLEAMVETPQGVSFILNGKL
ncbi:MAG TPA: pilus assembly protein PilM [Candidatus Paceibacterota bacterium]|nr:pilus assembly protein PilM [Candidatus Paceibacterota bacterium]